MGRRNKSVDHDRYLRDADKIKEQSRHWHRSRKDALEALKSGPCLDCGGLFPPECMDWDHRPDENKVLAIGRMRFAPWQSVLDEIAKCDLVCANCHRIRTKRRLLDGAS